MFVTSVAIYYRDGKYKIKEWYDLVGDREQTERIIIRGGLGIITCHFEQGISKDEIFKALGEFFRNEIEKQKQDLELAEKQFNDFMIERNW